VIAVQDPDIVLGRFWAELRQEPRLSDLVALVPANRALSIVDGITLLPAVMALLGAPGRQLDVIDAAARAYVRAAGLHISEE
jgi:hypothetical protein